MAERVELPEAGNQTPQDDAARSAAHPGAEADQPSDIPAQGWKEILQRTVAEVKADNVQLMAAGLAFYALLAIVPALAATVSIYGIVADPQDIENVVDDVVGALPAEARTLIQTQLERIVAESSTGLGLTALVLIFLALWSASSGMQKLVTAVNTAYDEDEGRSFLRVRALALVLTLGAIVFFVVTAALIAFLPSLLEQTGLGRGARNAIGLVRWPLLLVAFMVGVAVVFRYGPDRDEPKWRWVSWGGGVAGSLWLVASIGFAIYARNFSSINETYGTLGAVVVLMLWLFITAFVVLFAAQLDAEMEQQTLQDTTSGEPEPMGRRDAVKADTAPPG